MPLKKSRADAVDGPDDAHPGRSQPVDIDIQELHVGGEGLVGNGRGQGTGCVKDEMLSADLHGRIIAFKRVSGQKPRLA